MSPLGVSAAGKAAALLQFLFGIIVQRKVFKVLPFQYLPKIGLGIYKVDGSLLKAVALLIADIAGILTVRTLIGRLQIIGGISCLRKKQGFLLHQSV